MITVRKEKWAKIPRCITVAVRNVGAAEKVSGTAALISRPQVLIH